MKEQQIEITNGYEFGFHFGMGITAVIALWGVAMLIQQYFEWSITN